MSKPPLLTIGMACYDDFDGVWFSIKGLLLYHPEVLSRSEILVIDNNPQGSHGQEVKKFLKSIRNARYIEYTDAQGTAQPRNRIFAEAQGEFVLGMDCHVLFDPGSLTRLLDYYETHPETGDLLQGPLIGDRGTPIGTHQELTWRKQALGIWATDERGKNPDAPPFEIPQQGMGCFSCRKEAWVGFHPDFRGFGGCETYIAERFRAEGHKVLCLPFLRWHHRFPRPNGVSHRLDALDQLRNYLITAEALGWDREEVIQNYCQDMQESQKTYLLTRLGNGVPAPNPEPAKPPSAPVRASSPKECPHETFETAIQLERQIVDGRLQTVEGTLIVKCSDCGGRFNWESQTPGKFALDLTAPKPPRGPVLESPRSRRNARQELKQ